MAISNFKLPTGLEVSGSTVLTGTLDVSGLVNVTTLTASVGVSGAVGNFGTLNAGALSVPSLTLSNNLIVSGNTTLGDGVGTDIVQVNGQLTASNGLNITAGTLNASAVAVSASALNVTNDISARSASLSGDLTVNGNLSVKGTTTYIDSTTVNIGDKNLNIGTGSSTLSVLDGGGLDLGTGAEVQWRYDNANTAWTSNVDINLSASKSLKLAGVTAVSRAAGVNALVNSTNGSVSIAGTGLTTVSGSLTASVTAPVVNVGSVLATSASLNAANNVNVGSVSTLITAINGVNTTVYGTNIFLTGTTAIYLSSSATYVTGASYHNSLVSGTTAQFTVVTGSTVTGTLATFTTVSASAMSASTILVNSIAPNFRYEAPSAVQTINTLQTGTIDTFSWGVGGYGGAKYVIKAKEQAGTNYCHMVELLVATDGTYALGTPYGSTYTGPTAIMSFDVAINGANVDVKVINNSAQTVEVKWIKDYLTR